MAHRMQQLNRATGNNTRSSTGDQQHRDQALEPSSAATRNPLSPTPPPMPDYPGVPGPSPFPAYPTPADSDQSPHNSSQDLHPGRPPAVFHNISNSAGMTNPRSSAGSNGVGKSQKPITTFGRSPDRDRPHSAGTQSSRGAALPLYPPAPDVGPIADLTRNGAAPVSPTHATKGERARTSGGPITGAAGSGNISSPSRPSSKSSAHQSRDAQPRTSDGIGRWSADEFGFRGALANKQEVLAGLPPPEDSGADDGGGVRRLTLPAQTFDRWKNSGELRGDVPFQVNAKEYVLIV